MLHLPGMGPGIAACSTPQQLVENAKAGRVRLDKKVIESVRKIAGVPDLPAGPA
jgi:aryl-alcohol dehydrogenase-like predicted oxidoreductase